MSAAPLLEARGVNLETPGGRPLVRDLNVCLGRERVAVVGRNGVGKSTLLNVLAGRATPASGHLVRRGTCELVPQQLPDAAEEPDAPPCSPGERRRRRLLRAINAQPDLLLLDEPTLDLDQGQIAWLTDWLPRARHGLVVVSHDRRVLRCFDQFFVVAESGCWHFEGRFELLLAELERRRAAGERRYLGELHRMEASERHHATVRRRRERKKNLGRIHELKRCPARIKLNDKRSYKQESQARRHLLQRLRLDGARASTQTARRSLPVELPLDVVLGPLPAASGAPVLIAQGLTAVAGDRTLFRDVSLRVERERIAVRGPNGSGKTTLLELCLGLRAAAAGRVRCDRARVGYVAQNGANWRAEQSLMALLEAQRSDGDTATPAQVLRAHRFPVALAERPLATLSPGERIRAALLCLTRRRPAPELLVLDEPTQDLDFVGVAALESILAAWPGGLLVVSHDPEFVQAIGVRAAIDLGRTSGGSR